MSNTGSQPNQFVLLHVADSFETAEAGVVEQWARQSGLDVERCTDVYIGLARALKNSTSSPGGAVVCVAGMPPEQFEFFELTSRARRDLTVLVYSARSPERVVRALQSGASGLASQSTLAGLAARLKRANAAVDSQPPPVFVNPAKVTQPEPIHEANPPGNTSATAAETAKVIYQPEPPEPCAPPIEPQTEEQHSDQEVRVPWLRYNGGPTRQKPAVAADLPVEAIVPGEAEKKVPTASDLLKDCEGGEQYEPLLSEQELAALLGDDFDDVAAREREMLTEDSDRPGSGTR